MILPTIWKDPLPAVSMEKTQRPEVRASPGSPVSGLIPHSHKPVPTMVKLPSAPSVVCPGPETLSVMLVPVSRLVRVSLPCGKAVIVRVVPSASTHWMVTETPTMWNSTGTPHDPR